MTKKTRRTGGTDVARRQLEQGQGVAFEPPRPTKRRERKEEGKIR